MLHLPWQRTEFETFDKAVDDAQLDARGAFEFLRQQDNTRQRIAGFGVDLLKLVGELKDLCNGDALADQRRFQLLALRDELVELAADIEAEKLERQLLGFWRNLRAGRHL